MAADSTAQLRRWMQDNHIYDNDLMRLLPKYGVKNGANDLHNLSQQQLDEIQTFLVTEKRAELKDSASNQRFQKKLNKLIKLWKQQRKQKPEDNSSTANGSTKHKSSASKDSTSSKKSLVGDDGSKSAEIEQLRNENRRIRRELSAKNSDYNRLMTEFKSYQKQSEEELKKLRTKYAAKEQEYDKLFKNYKQINQRVNSKYHSNNAKDKEINNLRSDKTDLMKDINEIMKKEQEKYDALRLRYEQLKEMNNRNLKWKLRYQSEKEKQKASQIWDSDQKHAISVAKHRGRANYTVDLNDGDMNKIKQMDDEMEFDEEEGDMSVIDEQTTLSTSNSSKTPVPNTRPKKFKPSKQKRKRASQLSAEFFRNEQTLKTMAK